MERSLARKQRLNLQRRVGATFCCGWTYHCAHCGNVFDRYEAALRASDYQLAERLQADVLEQGNTLGRRR